MKLISAFPCLDKTTFSRMDRVKYFDREFNETRSIQGLNQELQDKLFDSFADVVELQLNSTTLEILFITDDARLLDRLIQRGYKFSLIIPDYRCEDFMKVYKNRVIARSGEDWYNNIIVPRLKTIEVVEHKYRNLGIDIYFATLKQPFVSDIIASM